MFKFIRNLFSKKVCEPLTEREKLEKECIDALTKW